MNWNQAVVLPITFAVGCATSERPTVSAVERHPIHNAYAQGFQTFTIGDARGLIVFGPGGTSDTSGHFLLVPHGAPVPLVKGATVVRVPLERVAVLSTTHLSFLAALDLAGRVVGGAHLEQVMDEAVKEQLPPDVERVAGAAGIDRELLIALAPDAVFDYPFGKLDDTGQHLAAAIMIPITEYLEMHPLGRAEWIRPFGMLMGRERQADSLFEAVRERYEVLAGDVEGHAPSVIFGSTWQGQWWVPGRDTYMSTLITDAGGAMAIDGRPGRENVAIDLETLLAEAAPADHLGVLLAGADPVDAMLLAGGDARVEGLTALQRGGFYGNSATADLFGRALLEPDVVLQDLRCIFHPHRCQGHRYTYFFPLAQ